MVFAVAATPPCCFLHEHSKLGLCSADGSLCRQHVEGRRCTPRVALGRGWQQLWGRCCLISFASRSLKLWNTVIHITLLGCPLISEVADAGEFSIKTMWSLGESILGASWHEPCSVTTAHLHPAKRESATLLDSGPWVRVPPLPCHWRHEEASRCRGRTLLPGSKSRGVLTVQGVGTRDANIFFRSCHPGKGEEQHERERERETTQIRTFCTDVSRHITAALCRLYILKSYARNGSVVRRSQQSTDRGMGTPEREVLKATKQDARQRKQQRR